MNNIEFSLLICVAVCVGFAAILVGFGSIGRSNVYRGFMIFYSALICVGYLTQHFVYEEPPNFMGFPLMGIVCWGGIGLMQILHIRLNNQHRRLDQQKSELYKTRTGW